MIVFDYGNHFSFRPEDNIKMSAPKSFKQALASFKKVQTGHFHQPSPSVLPPRKPGEAYMCMICVLCVCVIFHYF